MPRYCISGNPRQPFQPLYLGNDAGIGALGADAILAAPAILLKFDDDLTDYTVNANGTQRVITLRRPIDDEGRIIDDDIARILIDEQIRQIIDFQKAGGSVVLSADLNFRIGQFYRNNAQYFHSKLTLIRNLASEERTISGQLQPPLTIDAANRFFANANGRIPDISVMDFMYSKILIAAKRPLVYTADGKLVYNPLTLESFTALRRFFSLDDMPLSIQDIPRSVYPIKEGSPPTLALYAQEDVQAIMKAQIQDAGFRKEIDYAFNDGMGFEPRSECYTVVDGDGRKKVATVLPFAVNNRETESQIVLYDNVIEARRYLERLRTRPEWATYIPGAEIALGEAIAEFTTGGAHLSGAAYATPGTMIEDGWPNPIARRDINSINKEALAAALNAIIANQNDTRVLANEINISVPINNGGHWYYCHIIYQTSEGGRYNLTTTFAETLGQTVHPNFVGSIHQIIQDEFISHFGQPSNPQTIDGGGLKNDAIVDQYRRGVQVEEVGSTCGPTICQYSKILLENPDAILTIGDNGLEVIDDEYKASKLVLSHIKSLARHDEENKADAAHGLYFRQNGVLSEGNRPPEGQSRPRAEGVSMRGYYGAITPAQIEAVTDLFLDDFTGISNTLRQIPENEVDEDEDGDQYRDRRGGMNYVRDLIVRGLINEDDVEPPTDYDPDIEPDTAEKKLYRLYLSIKNKVQSNDLRYLDTSNQDSDLSRISLLNKSVIYLQHILAALDAINKIFTLEEEIDDPRENIKYLINNTYTDKARREGRHFAVDDSDYSELDEESDVTDEEDGSVDSEYKYDSESDDLDGDGDEEREDLSPTTPDPSSPAASIEPEMSDGGSEDSAPPAGMTSLSRPITLDGLSGIGSSQPSTAEHIAAPTMNPPGSSTSPSIITPIVSSEAEAPSAASSTHPNASLGSASAPASARMNRMLLTRIGALEARPSGIPTINTVSPAPAAVSASLVVSRSLAAASGPSHVATSRSVATSSGASAASVTPAPAAADASLGVSRSVAAPSSPTPAVTSRSDATSGASAASVTPAPAVADASLGVAGSITPSVLAAASEPVVITSVSSATVLTPPISRISLTLPTFFRDGTYKLTPLPRPMPSPSGARASTLINPSRLTTPSRTSLRERILTSFYDDAEKRKHDENKAKFKLGILVSEDYSVDNILGSTPIYKRPYENLGFNAGHTSQISQQFPLGMSLDKYDLSLIINGSNDRTAITKEDGTLTDSAKEKFSRLCESLTPRNLDIIYEKFFDSVKLSQERADAKRSGASR